MADGTLLCIRHLPISASSPRKRISRPAPLFGAAAEASVMNRATATSPGTLALAVPTGQAGRLRRTARREGGAEVGYLVWTTKHSSGFLSDRTGSFGLVVASPGVGEQSRPRTGFRSKFELPGVALSGLPRQPACPRPGAAGRVGSLTRKWAMVEPRFAVDLPCFRPRRVGCRPVDNSR